MSEVDQAAVQAALEVAAKCNVPFWIAFTEKDLQGIPVEEARALLVPLLDRMLAVLREVRASGKHAPMSWRDEYWKSHMVKGTRHALSHHLVMMKLPDKPAGEDHLARAALRLAMAAALEE